MAKTRFGSVLECFRGDSIGIWLDKIWNCLRIFSRRFKWILAQTRFGFVLEYFRGDSIGIWLRQGLDLSENIFGKMQL